MCIVRSQITHHMNAKMNVLHSPRPAPVKVSLDLHSHCKCKITRSRAMAHITRCTGPAAEGQEAGSSGRPAIQVAPQGPPDGRQKGIKVCLEPKSSCREIPAADENSLSLSCLYMPQKVFDLGNGAAGEG